MSEHDVEKKKKPRKKHLAHEEETTESTEDSAPDVEVEVEYADEAHSSQPEDDKVHIAFPYSDVVRAQIPKVFEVAETVATEWVKGGDFENIPVGHPVAQMTVAAGLRKAKEVEKKLEEKGVFMMAKMGLEFAKSKLKK